MPKYEVLVRVKEITETDSVAARRTVENQLRNLGGKSWQIVSISLQDSAAARAQALLPPQPRRPPRPPSNAGVGALVLISAAVLWSLWFLWALAD